MSGPTWIQPAVWGFATGFVSGVAVPVFMAHYSDALERHRKRQMSARFLIHELEAVRGHFEGICSQIDTLARSVGRGVVHDNVTSITKHREAIQAKHDTLFDLHDAALMKSIEGMLESWKRDEDRFGRHIHAPGVYAGGPIDTSFIGEYMIYRDGIKSSVIRNIDAAIAALRRKDVPFIWWFIHKGRG